MPGPATLDPSGASLPPGLEQRLSAALPADVEWASARLVAERSEHLSVRRGVVEPVRTGADLGVMITVWHRGGCGYGATSDLTDDGLSQAVAAARRWAEVTAGLAPLAASPLGDPRGSYAGPVQRPWAATTLVERVELLREQADRLVASAPLVDWGASLGHLERTTLLVTNGGGRVEQSAAETYPSLWATANDGSNTQTRTYGGGAYSGQGGAEVLDRHGFAHAAPRLADEVMQLLSAPNCPGGSMDVVVAPDQMILQIHESIGHPLELDRILGDERNYAGGSFVTLDMLGSYRYGSELLNVTFDPGVAGELAGYAFDDDGSPAQRVHLIRAGLLERPLGGRISQVRAGVEGTANSRACAWNRPAIDRMANLNVEPGDSTLEGLIAATERGVYLETNNSWSIDDRRNKFQFGCELGRLIVDGELGTVVRNPGYRGVSATFWRSLAGVADASTFAVMGVPNCGKGEPNQQIAVGHATPACRFTDVEVFGGE